MFKLKDLPKLLSVLVSGFLYSIEDHFSFLWLLILSIIRIFIVRRFIIVGIFLIIIVRSVLFSGSFLRSLSIWDYFRFRTPLLCLKSRKYIIDVNGKRRIHNKIAVSLDLIMFA